MERPGTSETKRRRRSEPTKGTSKVMVVSPITLKRPTLDDFDNYRIEYARSSDTECYCKDLIEEGEIQVCKKEEDTGLFVDWHHLRCWADLRDDFKFFSSGSCLPGFHNLDKRNQAIVLEKLPPVNNENLPPAAKRAHLNTVKTAGMNDMDIKMMIQNEKFFNMRNKLENQKVT
ncbi:poly [ADP-ribose] polymerase-like isoform X2 [Chelonus insularis]|uniref:poly [ADP-ribose] polymerase-like isoform X2 n=1 Tax=Chelonus insularis TaxID=460826 RepID=UPI00158F380B|nr:poly [ADP-ribose] polymerase-like isoform X2 [Chelonus insularis]XP_034938500.1 poly [ADP-ribose] polymerase-like isoform X2 [Chelonus insularis]